MLDRPVELGPTIFGDGTATLRDLLNGMVCNKENWSAALTGRAAPQDGCTSVEGMKKRYAAAGNEFRRLVGEIRNRGEWDSGFVDALCDPPESFTYGGMLAHVATFSTVRRSLAIVAFRQLGVENLGIGDPISWERSFA